MRVYDCWIWGRRGKVIIEAEDLRSASARVKEEYPDHRGYFLVCARENIEDPIGVGIEYDRPIPLHAISLTGYIQV